MRMIKRLAKLRAADQTFGKLSGKLFHFAERDEVPAFLRAAFRKIRAERLFFLSNPADTVRVLRAHLESAEKSTDSASRRARSKCRRTRFRANFSSPYSIVVTSPLPETGIETASLTARSDPNSPNLCSPVRACAREPVYVPRRTVPPFSRLRRR